MRHHHGRGLFAGACGLAILLGSSSVLGQAGSADVATAEALFQEAVRLMEAGRAAEACPKFAESHRLDPQGGVAFELGLCYVEIKKLSSAWGAFNEAAARWRLRADKREADARKRAQDLEPKLSKLTIVVPAAARVAGLTVKRDGVEVGQAQWDLAVPVDSGDVTLEASAPGHESFQRAIKIDRPGVTNVEIPVLAKEKKTGPVAAVPGAREERASFWGPQRIAAVGVAGAGFVSVVVGAVLGGVAAGKKGEMDRQCIAGDPLRCNDVGLAAYEDGKATAAGSMATLIGGGVLAGAGVALWLTAPSARAEPANGKAAASPRVRVSAGVTGASVMGTW